jgi:hypothetical protein
VSNWASRQNDVFGASARRVCISQYALGPYLLHQSERNDGDD